MFSVDVCVSIQYVTLVQGWFCSGKPDRWLVFCRWKLGQREKRGWLVGLGVTIPIDQYFTWLGCHVGWKVDHQRMLFCWDKFSTVYLSVLGCFDLLLTIHPLLRQAHRRLIRPGCVYHSQLLASLGGQLLAQVVSFLLSHSQWLWCSASSSSAFIVFLLPCPLTPSSLTSFAVELAMNPLHPTSTGHTLTFQPQFFASAVRLAYRSLFCSYALSTASFHGSVSSMIKTHQWDSN